MSHNPHEKTGDHELAIEVSKTEGGFLNLPISEIKEVIHRLRVLGRIKDIESPEEKPTVG